MRTLILLTILTLSGCAHMTERQRTVAIAVTAAVVAGAIVASQQSSGDGDDDYLVVQYPPR